MSQTGASRAQIGNRCVEGSAEGKGGNDGEKKGGEEKGRAPGEPGRYKPKNDQGRRGEGARIRREREKRRIKYDAEDQDLGRLNKESAKRTEKNGTEEKNRKKQVLGQKRRALPVCPFWGFQRPKRPKAQISLGWKQAGLHGQAGQYTSGMCVGKI